MANKLFQLPSEIIEGYNLTTDSYADKKERKVFLLGRALNSGNVSLFLYSCNNNKRERHSLQDEQGNNKKFILIPELSIKDKTRNGKVYAEAYAQCNALNGELAGKGTIYKPKHNSKIFVSDYLAELSKQALEQTNKKNSYHYAFKSLAQHIELYKDKKVLLSDIDKQWCLGFLDYLKYEAPNLNYTRSKDEEKNKDLPLSSNSQVRLSRNLNTMLKKALRQGLISENPFSMIETQDKPKEEKGTRVYMELEEVQRLIDTPFPDNRSKADFRNAFLFAVFSGLRYSDLRKITLSDIKKDSQGSYLEIEQTKTEEGLKIYLDDMALSFIPERRRTKEEPLFILPKNGNANDNKGFKQWFEDAKIEKHITWHCARHSTATIMLSAGEPLAVVSKQLGHGKIATTEIYAKIVDKAQAQASRNFANLFKK